MTVDIHPPVVPLHRCRKCDALASPVEVQVGDGPTTRFNVLCASCFRAACVVAGENRRLFDLPVTEGVAKECANKMLCAKVKHDAKEPAP